MKTRNKIILIAVIVIIVIFVINSIIPSILFRQQDWLGLILYTCTLGIERSGPLMLITYNNGTHTIDEDSCAWIKNRVSNQDDIKDMGKTKVLEPEYQLKQEKKFDDTVKVDGDMAEKICKIVGRDCPPYYIGNIQQDGSLMVGMTTWDADTKTGKSFVFIIKDNTLSYDVRENED